MNDAACQRWVRLSDRTAVGEPLTEEDARFLREHSAACAACAAEARVWESLDRCLSEDSEPPRLVDLAAPARLPVRRAWLRRGLLAGGAAAVAAAAALALVGRERAPEAASRAVAIGDTSVSLVLVSGAVEVRGVQASAGAALGTNDAVRSGDGRACLAYSTGISACVDVGSRLVLLDADAGHRRLRLDDGAVVCRLEPQPPGTRFSVDTAAGRITARGTVFAVEHLDGAEVAVRLHHGAVVVEAVDGSRTELGAPASVILGAGIRPTPPSGAGWDRDVRLSALAELWAEGATAPLDIDTRPPGARIALDGLDLGVAPLSALVGRGEHRVAVTAPGHAPFEGRFSVLGAERVSRTVELSPAAPTVSPPTSPAPTPAGSGAEPTAAMLLAQARSLRGAGRYAAAATAYQRLIGAHPRSAEARAALVSLGELQLSQLAQPAAALRSFEAYLTAGGALAQEARYGRIRALQQLGQVAAAREATAAFLRDYPGSAQARTLGEPGAGR